VAGNDDDVAGELDDVAGTLDDVVVNSDDMAGNMSDVAGNIDDVAGNVDDVAGNVWRALPPPLGPRSAWRCPCRTALGPRHGTAASSPGTRRRPSQEGR